MATHSSVLVWRIPWPEEPGRIQTIGLQRVRHSWSDLAHTQESYNKKNPKNKKTNIYLNKINKYTFISIIHKWKNTDIDKHISSLNDNVYMW